MDADRRPAPVTAADHAHLRRCVELAAEALDAGDEPFGSLLVDIVGVVRAEDRNRVNSIGDRTRHPGVRARPLGGDEPHRGRATDEHGVHVG